MPTACPKSTTKPVPNAAPGVGVDGDGVGLATGTGTRSRSDGSDEGLTHYACASIAVAGSSMINLLVYLLFDRSRQDEVVANDKDLEFMGRVDDGKGNDGGVKTLLIHRGWGNGSGSAAAG